MLVLAKAVLAMMIGFIIAIFLGIVLVPMLKKLKVNQQISIFLESQHKKKKGTPTMGGLIFIFATIISVAVLLLMGKIEWSVNLSLIIFVFISYALIGFIDDYLIIVKKNNDGLSWIQKLILQVIIAIVFFYLFMKSGNEPVIDIPTLNISIKLGVFYPLFILFMLVGSSNAVNLTDGLDGLAGGLSAMAYLAFALITWNTTWMTGSESIAIFCFILVGSLLAYLVFNTYPAKIIMGDTGALTLGATLASIALITSHEITFVVVMGVFIFETVVTLIQMFAGRYFGRKVFLMTPYHHHLEKIGYKEQDIVKGFWVVGLILSMLGIIFAVWI